MKISANIQILLSLSAFAASIAAPIIYVGAIKTDVAVAQTDVRNIDSRVANVEANYEYVRRLMEQIALKDGVNVDKIKQEILSSKN